MTFVCKLCTRNFSVTADFVDHFNQTHRVSKKSYFTCGIINCVSQFCALDAFNRHVSEFHSKPISNCDEAQSERISPALTEDDDRNLYKCPYPQCIYTAQNKASIRSHRFRQHANASLGSSNNANSVTQSEIIPGAQSLIPDELCESDLKDPQNFCDSSSFVDTNTGESHCDSESNILHSFALIFLTLNSKFHVPDSTVQFILDKYHALLKKSSDLFKMKIITALGNAGIDSTLIKPIVESIDDPIVKLHSPQGPMRSSHQRHKQYSTLFNYIPPVGFTLGFNENNLNRVFHYVKIEESLTALLQDSSIYEQIIEREALLIRNKETSPIALKDIHDGSLFRSHKIFSNDSGAIQLELNQDDVNITNVLGSGKGEYKLNAFYYTIANLYPWARSKVHAIQLISYCKEKDVAYFGFPRVCKPMLEELRHLEENGITAHGRHFKVHVLVLTGDNLGTHSIGGFLENFSRAIFFCRYCEVSREEWLKKWGVLQTSESDSDNERQCDDEDDISDDGCDSDTIDESIVVNTSTYEITDELNIDISNSDMGITELSEESGILVHDDYSSLLRTRVSYDLCVDQLDQNPKGVKGVVAKSCLNEQKFFHIIGASPPCVAHDLFEGVVCYDIALALFKLSQMFDFSLDEVNRKIVAFRLLGKDRNDRPAKVKKTKLSGHAVQNWVLLRFLPLMVGDLIKDQTHIIWQMVLLLIQIVQIVCSPAITQKMLLRLKQLITQYLQIRSTHFSENLRPKHHYLEHYPYLTTVYGPLMRVCTLKYESKHGFARETQRSQRNCKNVTKSLAKQHQLYQSALIVDRMFNLYPIATKEILLNNLPENIRLCILTTFGKDLSNIFLCENVIFQETEYQKGTMLVLSSNGIVIDLCKIECLVVLGKELYAVGNKCKGKLISCLQVHELKELTAAVAKSVSDIDDFEPYPIYHVGRRKIIVLKNNIF